MLRKDVFDNKEQFDDFVKEHTSQPGERFAYVVRVDKPERYPAVLVWEDEFVENMNTYYIEGEWVYTEDLKG